MYTITQNPDGTRETSSQKGLCFREAFDAVIRELKNGAASVTLFAETVTDAHFADLTPHLTDWEDGNLALLTFQLGSPARDDDQPLPVEQINRGRINAGMKPVGQLIRLNQRGVARVLEGKPGMMFIVENWVGVNNRCAVVLDYRYPRADAVGGFQCWTIEPEGFEIVREAPGVKVDEVTSPEIASMAGRILAAGNPLDNEQVITAMIEEIAAANSKAEVTQAFKTMFGPYFENMLSLAGSCLTQAPDHA